MGELILLRHGETEWSRNGRHTGRTDIPLTPGRASRQGAGPGAGRPPSCGRFTSPAQPRRADRASWPGGRGQPDPDLQEWDYGGYEGRTTPQIQEERPGWYLWRDGVIPGDAGHPGETVDQVGERADAVLSRVRPLLAGGDVALVSHGHSLRVLAARWLGLDAGTAGCCGWTPGTLSTLGTEHEQPVMAIVERARQPVRRRPARAGVRGGTGHSGWVTSSIQLR